MIKPLRSGTGAIVVCLVMALLAVGATPSIEPMLESVREALGVQ